MNVLVSAKNQAHAFACGPGEKILYAGLRAGIELPYECGTGTCGTCKARLIRGDVVTEWQEAPGHAGLRRAQGEFLMCQATTTTDCDLEISNIVKAAPASGVRPAHVEGTVTRRAMLTHDVASFDVELGAPVEFEAGQFMVMTVAGVPGARAYSMVNYEPRARRLVFVVKKKPGGRLSEWLFGDAVDAARVALFGPVGRATFHPDVGKHLLCIAGGSGIAGMMSILARACRDRYFERFAGCLFFGVRTARDLFFLDALTDFRRQAGGALEITLALSDEPVDPALAAAHKELAFAQGLVHAVAGERMKGRFANVRAYAAGPPPMVDATLRMLLLEARLTADNIRYDKFS